MKRKKSIYWLTKFSFVLSLLISPQPIQSADDNTFASGVAPKTSNEAPAKTILINFNNVSIIEYIRFVSRISNRNFVFDENDLQFNVTIISEEPATIDNIMTALLQELLIHNLALMEDGHNLIIHKNGKVNSISKVVEDSTPDDEIKSSEIITKVIRLNTLDPSRATIILRPLVSDNALLEALPDTHQIIVTDLSSNVEKISQLIKTIDAPNSGYVIGQYVSRKTAIDVLIPLVQQVMQPISQDQPLNLVAHPTTNSIFIISTPFLVERTIAILQYLDYDQGATRIFNLKELNYDATKLGVQSVIEGSQHLLPQNNNAQLPPDFSGAINNSLLPTSALQSITNSGRWIQDASGLWKFIPTNGYNGDAPPQGQWIRDSSGNWDFVPGGIPNPFAESGPLGRWIKDALGNWTFELSPSENFVAPNLNRGFQGSGTIPGGAEKKTHFFIYKLQYRKGESIEPVLRQIADTIQQNERGNEELISTLRSVQWLIAPNSLVFSGTRDALDKARMLTKELDTPMRQVFIEMLIMETSLADSLQFGVTYGTRFGGGNVSGSQGFNSGTNPLVNALATTGVTGLGGPVGNALTLVPNGTNLANTSGFNLGVIGQKITHHGKEFGSIGALVNALHDRTKDEVISNPKLLVEDASTAEIFVGINTPYRTQSIANDQGSLVTSNYQYQDVGTRLKVTPYLGNGDIIALNIEEEVSTIVSGLITDANSADTSPGPTTRINRTTTRVHIPDTYFLIISGMMQDEESRERNQVPCLGAIPILGALFSDKTNSSAKRNLMIFIRPIIIDTEEQIQRLTKHQQDIYDFKNCLQNSDEYETQQALDLMNVRKTLHPEDEDECDD